MELQSLSELAHATDFTGGVMIAAAMDRIRKKGNLLFFRLTGCDGLSIQAFASKGNPMSMARLKTISQIAPGTAVRVRANVMLFQNLHREEVAIQGIDLSVSRVWELPSAAS